MATELVAAPDRILRDATTTLTATFLVDGAPTDPGVTTIGIVNLAGAEVVAAGAPTVVGETGVRSYSLAGQAALGPLTVTWTSSVLGALQSRHEVVGAFLFSVREARAVDGSALADTVKYPAGAIEAARTRIAEAFEQICGVAFEPRGTRVVVDGLSSGTLLLPDRRILAVTSVETRANGTADWTAFSADELADVLVDDWGRLTRESLGTFPLGRRNVRVTYEHGHAQPPGDIRHAALLLLRASVIEAPVNPRATSISSEFGTFSLATAGTQGNPWSAYRQFGIPEVDAALARWREGRVGIG